MIVRFLLDDFLQTAADVILSSFLSGFGASGLLRQGGEWRSKIGWTVVAGVNDGILVRDGVDFPGSIAAGYYATAAEYAEAYRLGLEAAYSTPVWSVTYNAGTHKFTIASNIAVILRNGVVGSAGSHPDMGFASVDTASAVSHTAGNASYQSRQWIVVDRGSALPVSAAVVKDHNLSGTGTARFDVDLNPLDSAGLGSTGLVFTTPLTGTATRAASFTPVTQRYLRFVFDDVSNPVGYVSVAIARPSVYTQPSEAPSVDYAEDSEHFSEDLVAIDGSGQQVRRANLTIYHLRWQIDPRKAAAAADLAIFAAINALGVGGKLFAILDAGGAATTVHVKLRKPIARPWVAGTYWAIDLELAEAL